MSKLRFAVRMLILLGFMLLIVEIATRDFDGWLGKATVGVFAAAFLVAFIGRRLGPMNPPGQNRDDT